jgi:hypothetical protein
MCSEWTKQHYQCSSYHGSKQRHADEKLIPNFSPWTRNWEKLRQKLLFELGCLSRRTNLLMSQGNYKYLILQHWVYIRLPLYSLYVFHGTEKWSSILIVGIFLVRSLLKKCCSISNTSMLQTRKQTRVCK